MAFNYHWRTRPDVAQLEQAIDQLRADNIRLRHELQTKQSALGGLEMALVQRHETIDALRARLEQARDLNGRLDEEAERLAEMVRLSLGGPF